MLAIIKNQKKNPGFLLSAVSSNSGKTAAACGLMSAFKQEGKRVCACKCGPDYIDPMFHTKIIGVKSRNLDGFFFKSGADLSRTYFCRL